MNPVDFEKLGLFYLGRRHPTAEPFLLPSDDLLTHAVIVGMTGSGKTGLGITMLEEAAIDGIPAIIIDPKGDLSNLALTFPQLRAEDFLPYVDAEEATRKGQTPAELAAATAERWRAGLAEWGEDGARVARLRAAADVVVYTPGARTGVGLSLLRSFDAPGPALRDAPDLVRERAATAAAGLLGLVGVDADPLKSREHLLLTTLLERAWAEARSPSLADLVRGVAEPPFDKVGLFDLESFYPKKQRFELALAMNNLIASPSYAAWTEGEPLDIAQLLRGSDGRPRLAVISIAHLPDAQRMFFVASLLTEMVGWMRTQPGSSHLRALLYMDEIFGYFPPVASPPSKAPMLTLLKQARAFGLGVVLCTQNPVDLDYKGLGNTGTWMIGRLQTDRDKRRILDGLEGAAVLAGGRFDRGAVEATIGALEPRQFLVHSVHHGAKELLATRWALSYLRGPLTREQLAGLTRPHAPAAPAPGPVSLDDLAGPRPAEAPAPTGGERPVLPPEITELFAGDAAYYVPAVLGSARVHFAHRASGLDEWRTVALAAPLGDAALTAGTVHNADLDWAQAETIPAGTTLARQPATDATYAALPAPAARAASYTRWSKALEAHLVTSSALTLWHSPSLDETSRPGESQAQFRARMADGTLAERAAAAAKLRARYAARVASAEDKVARAQEKVSREASQASARTVDTAVEVGSSILGAIFGGRRSRMGTLGRARTAARAASRTMEQRADVGRAQDELDRARATYDALETEVREAVSKIEASFDPTALVVEPVEVKPKRTDVTVGTVALLWRPGRP